MLVFKNSVNSRTVYKKLKKKTKIFLEGFML